MKWVVADDLSGAAECAGVAWRHGLDAELITTVPSGEGNGVQVVDTDTRLLPAPEAAGEVRRRVEGCWSFTGGVFKKTDSVLRGPVRAELQALAEISGCSRALLVPSNPSLGRTVENGRLLIRGRPLDETEFARDPHHPAHTADAAELLGRAPEFPISVASPGDPLPEKGIIVGNARTTEDLRSWAERSREAGILPAGAAAFLSAILENRGWRTRTLTADLPSTAKGLTLICSGTAAPASHREIARLEAGGTPVRRMPPGLANQARPVEPDIEEWARAVSGAFTKAPRVVACIGQAPAGHPESPRRFEQYLSELVARVLAERPIRHLLLEGGATASAVLRRLGWSRFQVVREHAPGVVCLRTRDGDAPLITIKPGSYPWVYPFAPAGI